MKTEQFNAMLEDLYEGYDATVTNGKVSAKLSYNMHSGSKPFTLQYALCKKTFWDEANLLSYLITWGFNWKH